MNPEYLKEIRNIPSFKLAIMGKEPYPFGATGVPFLKKTWDEMNNEKCSGKYVLESLGFAIDVLILEYNNPFEFFKWLAHTKRIVFLNLSYELIGGRIMGDNQIHTNKINSALIINIGIVEKCESIILCGEAKYLINYYDLNIPSVDYCHPDNRNRTSEIASIKKEWWSKWDKNCIKNSYNL